MSGALLRKRVASGDILVAPGIHDMMSLLLVNKYGFGAHYASGYWNAASTLGEPDVGIAGYRDFIAPFARMAEKSSAPIIADADTGFGSLANLDHCVRGYAHAGIGAIQIEDQSFPKRCGHSGPVDVVPIDEMRQRVKVASEARGDDDMLIIARTDARLSEGLDAALNRLKAYAEAGADWLFLEAPISADEINRAATTLNLPLMINAAHGGKTPILQPSQYEELGVSIVIYPAGGPLSAAAAADKFFARLSGDNASQDGDAMFDFAEMTQLLGMERIAALQKRFGKA
ncbi:MAG: isocitrate lyase/PEP mutase family protein [Erythrobacter sp.]|uniref:isocitrate lyase/PEP mutase family protein n=1 Tax=Erythrobacter sp. TaxID=1042 RepID=UPI00329724F0